MDERTFKAAQILALRAVEDPTFEDMFARIQRWYSNQYHVPIDRIDTVPDEKIVKAWFEEQFLAMKSNPDEKIQHEYQALKNSILFEDELAREDDEDAAWEREMVEAIKREQGIVKPEEIAQDPNLSKELLDNGRISGIDDYYVPED